ncbi:MAG TPA: hypothetical protein VKQ28_15865 [Candidatus Acidoferrum sp.]|nr:hypothetical protein [Candidatus Acidoferrum sp.]
MLERKLLAALTVICGSLGLTGCWGDAARSVEAPRTLKKPAAASEDRNPIEADPAGKRPHRGRRASAYPEGFLTTYHNPEAGILFRYPRNYSLEEGEVQEHSFFLKRQEDLDSEEPGARLVATVLIPEDGYPNTTFEHGSLQLVMEDEGSEKGCRDSAMAAADHRQRGPTIEGIEFWRVEEETEVGGSKVLERNYVGYSRGACYQFLLTVAAENRSEPNEFKRTADTDKILKQLEKIVFSTQINERREIPMEESGDETRSACDHNHQGAPRDQLREKPIGKFCGGE